MLVLVRVNNKHTQSNHTTQGFILVRISSPQESYVQSLSNTSGFHYPRVQSPSRTLTHPAAAGLLFTTRRGNTTPWISPDCMAL
ncbi:hypothetical protein Taro_021061 [Colocasia esculenta]|uniref:Uncharacterized protein n=1 Tax=Colocasia esculenta TaxID=4460 RepID=A0A843V3X8_COLES|nr:hypothetical protein [Colocasia esculenta]